MKSCDMFHIDVSCLQVVEGVACSRSERNGANLWGRALNAAAAWNCCLVSLMFFFEPSFFFKERGEGGCLVVENPDLFLVALGNAMIVHAAPRRLLL